MYGGKNLAQNAAPHVKKRFVLTLDITDFFGSIRFDQVYSAAFNARYFPRQIGVMLTALWLPAGRSSAGCSDFARPLQSGDAEL